MAKIVDEKLLDQRRALGVRIRAWRKDKGWSQDTFAHMTGMGRSYPYRIEEGELDLRLSTLVHIAEAMEMTLSELLKDI